MQTINIRGLPGLSSTVRARRVVCLPKAQQDSNNERKNYNVRKGKQYENARRRRGRPAHLRSPYDSPLRDGNRDRLIGLLTERAAKTLMIYLMETNGNVYSWLVEFYKKNPIPRDGSWDEISGEAFLRKLLSMPIEEARVNTGRDSLFDNVKSCGVDPRSIAQRIMDIRTQLSEEFVQELQAIAEENSLLLRETLHTSLASTLSSLQDPTTTSKESPAKQQGPDKAAAADTPTNKDSSSTKSGSGVGTPPPSPSTPAPAKPVLNSNPAEPPPDVADKAAAVAALNAALKKSTDPGSVAGGASSHPEMAEGQGDDSKVNLAEMLAQLRRAMEADVARDVRKMTESTASSSKSDMPTPAVQQGVPEAGQGVTSGEAAGANQPEPELPQEQGMVPVDVTTAAAAADAVPFDRVQPADGSMDESDCSGSMACQLSSSTVGEAGTYSRMLPKGWGPRLGVGFSSYPRSRNNIVSSANLGGSKSPSPASEDAMSGSGAAGESL